MKLLLSLLILFSISFAYDAEQVRQFINSSVHQGNAQKLGFTSADEVTTAVLGSPLYFATVESDSLNSYPATGFATESSSQYIPLLVDGRAVCFVIVNESGMAVSLGYKQLADELTKVSVSYGVALESIKLYSSNQISSYLFSVPVRQRSDEANLTILRPGWDRSRSLSLSTEADVIAQIKAEGR